MTHCSFKLIFSDIAQRQIFEILPVNVTNHATRYEEVCLYVTWVKINIQRKNTIKMQWTE